MKLPRYNLKAILALVALTAVLSLLLKDWFVNDAPLSLLSPIRTSIFRSPNGETTLDLMIHPVGDYAVADFGSIRLAVETKSVSARPIPHPHRGTIRYRVEPKNNREGGGHSQTGRVWFSYRRIDYGCACRFVGLSFDIVNDNLNLLGASYPVDGAPTVIIVDATGKIEGVVQLSAKGPQHTSGTRTSHRH